MVQDFITGPRVLRRASRWCFIITCICATGAIVLASRPKALPWKQTPWYRASIKVLGLAPLLVVYPIGFRVQRRIRRAWSQSGGRLCTHCGYDLSALGDRGVCPECGQKFDARADAQIWKQALYEVPAGHPARSDQSTLAPLTPHPNAPRGTP